MVVIVVNVVITVPVTFPVTVVVIVVDRHSSISILNSRCHTRLRLVGTDIIIGGQLRKTTPNAVL